MGRITKNYLYNLAYQILTIIAPIVTAPYLSRVLGPDNLGIYSYVGSSGNVIATFALLGIYAYGNRQVAYVREDKEALNTTFWEIMRLRCILGAAGTAAYIIYSICNKGYGFFFAVYYPYLLAQFIDCSWIFVGLEDMKPAVIKNFVTKLVNIAGIFILIKSRDDVWKYIALLAVTTLIATISVYSQLRKYIGKPVRGGQLVPHLKKSVALFLPQLASLFYLQVDKMMLKWFTGTTDQVSFYDHAEKIVTIPLSIITVISTVMMPRIANEYQKGRIDSINDYLLKAGKITLCMAMPMMVGIFCIARHMIPWYLGEDFSPTATAIMLISPIILFNALSGISGKQYFTATDQTGILLKSYVSAAVANMAANALLIPRYGFIGAAVATVLSSLLSVVVQYVYLCRQVNMKPLLQYGIRYSIGAALIAAVLLPTEKLLDDSILTTAVQTAAGIVIYALYLIAIKDDALKGPIDRLKHKIKAKSKNAGYSSQ